MAKQVIFLSRSRLHQLRLVRRVDEADQDRAGLHGVDHRQRRRLDRQNHVGVGHQRGAVIEEGDILEGASRRA